MTDRDRLIELLKGNLPCHINEVAFWHDEHIGVLADHLMANGVIVGDAKNATTTWRPASEPPTEDGKYLVVRAYGAEFAWQEVCRFANNLFKVDKKDFKGKKRAGWYIYCDGEFIEILTVTHWMPLPQPPKEVE